MCFPLTLESLQRIPIYMDSACRLHAFLPAYIYTCVLFNVMRILLPIQIWNLTLDNSDIADI